MTDFTLALALAFALDLLLGDPPTWPHPVRWMGAAVRALEPRLRERLPPPAAGCLLVAILVPGTWLLASAAVALAGALGPGFATVLEALLLWTCFSSRSLLDAAQAVRRPLARGDLETARRRVGMIVGRETDRLDADGVARAAVETVAENLVDGVLAPLFFALLGGAPLAVTYKMVNTLDSMVGYRNPRYILFGRCAARLDDLANYLPARLAVPVIALAASLLGRRGRGAWCCAWRDGRKSSSPNAGLPEAAFAGALGVRLGGPSRYHGRKVEKPFIGEEFRPVRADDIGRACQLMLVTVLIAFGVVALASLPWAWLYH